MRRRIFPNGSYGVFEPFGKYVACNLDTKARVALAEMSEANAEDGLFRNGRQSDTMSEAQNVFGFCLLRPFRPTPTKTPPAFLPRPLLRAETKRKTESAGVEAGRKRKPPDKMFRPAESALIEIRVRIGLKISSDFVQERQQKKKQLIQLFFLLLPEASDVITCDL